MVVFLLHGYVSSSSAALQRTLLISGAISVVSTILEGIFIWPLHIQLYTYQAGDSVAPRDDMGWDKWAFWVANSLAFTVVYFGLMLLPLTRWRDLLPSKDMFHYYVRILFGVNLVRSCSPLFGLAGNGWFLLAWRCCIAFVRSAISLVAAHQIGCGAASH